MIRIDGSLQTPSTYTKQPGVKIRNLWAALLAGSLILGNHAQAQTNINYNDFTAFKSPGKNWKTASKAIADLNRDNLFKIEKGTGILVNVPGKNKGTDLYTADEFGDLDLEMDYMVAKNAKSGIFLQDNYLVSLSDSWKITTPLASDNGGIYERWDEGRGKGNEAYEGHPARQNVSRAPGLWQHIKIIFKAPRFNSSGKKIENAKILQLELNGVTVQENLELSGPSRGAPGNEETAMGPIRILGENGAIAFKNLVIKKYKGEPPTLSDLKYVLYYGKYETVPDFTKLPPPAEQGDLHILNSSFVKRDVEFLVRYTGNVHIYHEDDYVFQRETYGNGTVKINNTMVGDLDNYISTPIHLAPGTYPLEMIYTKALGWLPTSFGLTISSPDTRAFLISDETSLYRETPDPIVIGTPGNTILRSFMDIPEGKRIIHNVNVGSPQQLHYSYDMDNGAVFQLWRGKFIDAIPMWFSRGDGSSKPVGSRLQLGIPKPSIVKLLSLNDSIPADTSGSSFVTRGYELDNKNNQTIFVYDAHGTAVRDALQVTGNGGELKRTVSLEKNVGNLFIRIAEGEKIEHLSKGWYLVDDAKYYIHIDDGSPAPSVRQSGNKSVLVAPVQNSFSYSILF